MKDDLWKSTMKMMDDAKEMVRDAQEMAESMEKEIGEKSTITYRLRGGNWRERVGLAMRILTQGEVTIRISSNTQGGSR